MTEKANPSINRPAEAFKTAGAIAYGGHGGDGFVVDGANPTDIAVQDGGITEADLNAFAQTSGGASLDVTIDGGEAFVFGSWLAIDTDTTVTLAASTAGQTVYVGWNKNGADDVIVGLASDFSDASGDTDERIPLWTFDTDGTGVTTVTDDRRIGYTQEATTFTGSIDLQDNSVNNTDNILGTNGGRIDFQFGGNNDTAIRTEGKDIVLRDTLNGVRLLSAQEGGIIDIRADIDLLDSDSILDNGTEAITFNGSQDVEIPNGGLGIGHFVNGDLVVNDADSNTGYTSLAHRTPVGSFTEEDIFTRANYDAVSIGRRDETDNGVVALKFLTRDGATTHGGRLFHTSPAASGISRGFHLYEGTGGGTRVFSASSGGFDVGDVTLGLPQFTSDPTASAGDMWYRSDLD